MKNSSGIDAAAVADRFGLGAGAHLDDAPQRGELGEVWRLRTDTGAWAVKRCYTVQHETDADQTTRFQQAAMANGVYAPAPVYSRDGTLLVDVGSTQVRVYDWVDLAPVDRHLDVAAVAETLARAHTVAATGPVSGRDPWFTEPIPPARWAATIADATAAGAPFAQALTAHHDELVDAASLVTEPGRLQPCHRDLFAENLRAGADGRVCVIDWDNAGLADPSYELAMVLWEFARGDAERTTRLYHAYQDAGGPGRIHGPGSFSMIISIESRLLHRACRIWLDPRTSPAERDRRAADVIEWIDDPCTRPVIEAILTALPG